MDAKPISGPEVLTPAEMGRADTLAISGGPFDGYGLMLNAGRAIHREILARFPKTGQASVLCGPGNNGGDGYVVARLLAEDGIPVRLYVLAPPRAGTDAARAAADCPVAAEPLDRFVPGDHGLVVDALFGAGLSKPLDNELSDLASRVAQASIAVVAIDLPSGLSGDSGKPLGASFAADLTVTFFRKKPGHLLYPGRRLCGETVVANIGIPDDVLGTINPATFENGPALWREAQPHHPAETFKYARGAVGVFTGGPSATGAGRLAAMAAARSGAGAVTVLSPPSAMLVNACHLTSIMLRATDNVGDLGSILGEGKTSALVIGPGFGVTDRLRAFVAAILSPVHWTSGDRGLKGVVLDADALTAFAGTPGRLFEMIAAVKTGGVVITPHEGEFKRLFPALADDPALSKLDRARQAAVLSRAVVVLKGADTVIASPDGRAAINTNGTQFLATAGSGDVLAGLTGGLLAQGMPGFEAACAAVWLHGESGKLAGSGAIAEDLVDALRRIGTLR